MTYRQALTEVEAYRQALPEEELRSPDLHPYTSYQILYEALEGTAAKLLEVAHDAKESFELASQETEKYAKILDAASQALDKADRDLEVLETLWDTHKVRIHEWLAEKENPSGGR